MTMSNKECKQSSTSYCSTSQQQRRMVWFLLFFVSGIIGREFFVPTASLMAMLPLSPSISETYRCFQSPKDLDSKSRRSTASTEVGEEEPVIYYSIARQDRAGMVLTSMLSAHAKVFSRNRNMTGERVHHYAGACDITPPRSPKFRRQQQQLIQDLGLQNILKFACPPLPATTANEKKQNMVWLNVTGVGIPRPYQTPEWLAYLRSQVDWEKLKTDDDDDDDDGMFRIAVHLRRGDVTPCNKFKHRYLPNAHYLRLLDLYTPKDRPTRVYIFSERKSSESWAPCQARNYTMMLDAPLNTTWAYMMRADVFIMGLSGFSMFPAVFNNNTVIYTPYNFGPTKGWKVLNHTYLDHVKQEAERLVRLCERKMAGARKRGQKTTPKHKHH